MKKFLVAMGLVAFAVIGCDDSSSAAAEPNGEPGAESSSSSSGKVTELAEVMSSSSEKAKSSSSVTQSDVKQSSSSEKFGKSSSSVIESSSSSVKLRSSSSVETPNSSSSELSESSSSSADEVESSSSSVIGCKTETEDNCEYGELIDDRDGQIYKTVKIGDQWWMAENLNYEYTKVTYFCFGYSSNSISWTCYDIASYGRLYTWAASIDSVKLLDDADCPQRCGFARTCNLPTRVQGVCPPDWHLPSQAEWETLFTAAGGRSIAGRTLKSQSGWYNNGNGTDAFGFSALPAGYRNSAGYIDPDSKYATFWSSTVDDSYDAYAMYLHSGVDSVSLGDNYKYLGYSVRCVKD